MPAKFTLLLLCATSLSSLALPAFAATELATRNRDVARETVVTETTTTETQAVTTPAPAPAPAPEEVTSASQLPANAPFGKPSQPLEKPAASSEVVKTTKTTKTTKKTVVENKPKYHYWDEATLAAADREAAAAHTAKEVTQETVVKEEKIVAPRVAAEPAVLAEKKTVTTTTETKPVEAKPAIAGTPVALSGTEPERTNSQPVPAPGQNDGEPLTQALVLVYSSNPQLKAQRESLKAVDEGVNQAFSGFLPYAEAGYAKGRERDSISHQNWNYGDTSSKSLSVRQDLFNGGESLAAYKTAKERVKAERAQLTAVEQQVLYDAIVAYTDVVEKQLVLAVNHRNVDVLGKQLEATRARFEVGELTRTDSAQSEARLARARSDERQALGDLEAARATYKRVIGVAPNDKVVLPPLPSRLPTSIEQANEWALAAHPSLEASKFLAQAAETTVDVRSAALWPDVSLIGSMQRNEGVAVTGGPSRADSDAVVLNVTIPIYQSGAEWSRIREAKNLAQQAKFNSMDVRNAVSENVERAWQDYMTAKALVVSSKEALDAAEIALEGITQENQSGLRTILDVLDTEQEAFVARLNVVKASRQEKTQAYRLLAAVGRLTAQDLGLPVDLHDPTRHYNKVKNKLLGS